MRKAVFYITLTLLSFLIGSAIVFVLDGFVWKGLQENFITPLATTFGVLVGHYFFTRKKT